MELILGIVKMVDLGDGNNKNNISSLDGMFRLFSLLVGLVIHGRCYLQQKSK